MAIPVFNSSSSAPIDPGGIRGKRISERKNQQVNRDLEVKLQTSTVPAVSSAVKAPTYAARLKSSLRNLEKISDPSFLEDGTPVVQAPDSVLLEASELWKDHIVAHFHGRRPSVTKILADLNPVWGKFGNITVRTVSDICVLIFIPSVQTREWVLQVGYWQADRCAFSVYPWTADGNLASQELLFAPTWAVLKNVPPQLYSLKGISVVASGIGDPLHTEHSRLDPFHLGDTKVKVVIDLAKTPPEAVEVRDTQGNSVRINVEYPSLPPKCINCGKFGHLLNRCHRPLMKRSHSEKKESGAKVVNASNDLTLKESFQAPIEETVEAKLKQRARSRSRRRSRSRAKARALSSPPEVLKIGDGFLQSQEEVQKSQQDNLPVVEVKESSQRDLSVNTSETATSQLEEGEIEVVSEVGQCSDKAPDPGTADSQEQDTSVWFTKNSRSYRRALRQFNEWKVNGAVGSPPKSSKLLLRGSPLKENCDA